MIIPKEKKLTVQVITKNNYCSGCGVCGGVCPVSAIEIKFNPAGEYAPEISDSCIHCGLCLKVCPFSESTLDEDAISARYFSSLTGVRYDAPVGYWLECFAGYSLEYREKSASGGLLTHTLKRLFETNQISKAVCVVPTEDPQKLFKFAVINTASQLSAASGSVYYPIEMSGIINEILKAPGAYAIVGLPCFIKGIRNAAEANPILKERVRFCLGLVCGQLKSKYYAEYLSCKVGLKETLKAVRFRGKDVSRVASDIVHEFTGVSGGKARAYWTETAGEVFTSRMFTLRACSFCDDIFAECADAAFMDAWHPVYASDPAGTSFVISRSPQISNLLSASSESVRREPIDNILLSQRGVLKIKRGQLPYRLYSAVKINAPAPQKRISASSEIGFFGAKDVEIKESIQAESRKIISEMVLRNSRIDAEFIDRSLSPLFVKKKFLDALCKTIFWLINR